MSYKYYNLAILVICVVIITVSIISHADDLGFSIFGFKWQIHCMSKHLLKINCALCGLTHSFCAIGHGQLAKAFEYHKLGPVLFCFILFQLPYRISAITLGPGKIKRIRKFNLFFAIGVFAALIVNWLVYLGGRVI